MSKPDTPLLGTVMVLCPANEATQSISFQRPFERRPNLNVVFETSSCSIEEIEHKLDLCQPALLILSRYVRKNGTKWITQARLRDIPSIFHLDDDLLHVPKSIGTQKFALHTRPERLVNLRNNLDASDLVYASTPKLADRLYTAGIQTPIFAGNLYCSISPDDLHKNSPPATGPVIGYMGSGTHHNDFKTIIPNVVRALQKFPDLEFELFGTIAIPNELTEFGDRVRHIPPVQDYDSFISTLQELGWWIGLAPLERNSFNDCKADTKWVEYSLSGIAVVASGGPVYQKACSNGAGLLADTPDQWNQAIHALLMDAPLRQTMVKNAQNKLRTHYSHDVLLRQIDKVYEQARTNMALRTQTT